MTKWLKVGIVIYDPHYWNKGIDREALQLWITYLFEKFPDLCRIGLTTWSKNERMVRLAKKLGLLEEGRIRKVRYYEGEYYDSVKLGVLREEWTNKAY